MAQTYDEKTYGQVAYEAYYGHFKDRTGDITPPYEDLSQDVINGWEEAGRAAANKVPKKDKLTDDNVA